MVRYEDLSQARNAEPVLLATPFLAKFSPVLAAKLQNGLPYDKLNSLDKAKYNAALKIATDDDQGSMDIAVVESHLTMHFLTKFSPQLAKKIQTEGINAQNELSSLEKAKYDAALEIAKAEMQADINKAKNNESAETTVNMIDNAKAFGDIKRKNSDSLMKAAQSKIMTHYQKNNFTPDGTVIHSRKPLPKTNTSLAAVSRTLAMMDSLDRDKVNLLTEGARDQLLIDAHMMLMSDDLKGVTAKLTRQLDNTMNTDADFQNTIREQLMSIVVKNNGNTASSDHINSVAYFIENFMTNLKQDIPRTALVNTKSDSELSATQKAISDVSEFISANHNRTVSTEEKKSFASDAMKSYGTNKEVAAQKRRDEIAFIAEDRANLAIKGKPSPLNLSENMRIDSDAEPEISPEPSDPINPAETTNARLKRLMDAANKSTEPSVKQEARSRAKLLRTVSFFAVKSTLKAAAIATAIFFGGATLLSEDPKVRDFASDVTENVDDVPNAVASASLSLTSLAYNFAKRSLSNANEIYATASLYAGDARDLAGDLRQSFSSNTPNNSATAPEQAVSDTVKVDRLGTVVKTEKSGKLSGSRAFTEVQPPQSPIADAMEERGIGNYQADSAVKSTMQPSLGPVMIDRQPTIATHPYEQATEFDIIGDDGTKLTFAFGQVVGELKNNYVSVMSNNGKELPFIIGEDVSADSQKENLGIYASMDNKLRP